MDQTWCPVCPVAVKGELLRCNEATAEQGLSLTIQDWEELQAKLFALLARQVRNYTKGESDSVPVETAQALLDSICFTLGLDLEDPGERGRELLARDLAKELTSRRERLRGEMVRGNILWVSLCRALPPVKNRAMQDTLRSIGGFWRRYDFVYLAQEIPCDIDYQLALPVSERMPDGISTATLYAAEALSFPISSAYAPFTSRDRPIPSNASTIVVYSFSGKFLTIFILQFSQIVF